VATAALCAYRHPRQNQKNLGGGRYRAARAAGITGLVVTAMASLGWQAAA
jgi:hypothetical protein